MRSATDANAVRYALCDSCDVVHALMHDIDATFSLLEFTDVKK